MVVTICLRVTAFVYMGPGITIFGPPVYVPKAMSKSGLLDISTKASLNNKSLLIYIIALPTTLVCTLNATTPPPNPVYIFSYRGARA